MWKFIKKETSQQLCNSSKNPVHIDIVDLIGFQNISSMDFMQVFYKSFLRA